MPARAERISESPPHWETRLPDQGGRQRSHPSSAPSRVIPPALPRLRSPAWVPHPRSLINARAEPEAAVLREFVLLLLDIVLSSQGDLVPQVPLPC